jgi:hypothetical protein
MAKDPILDALHKTREKYAARFKNDLKAIYRDLKAKEEQGKFGGCESSSAPSACQTICKETLPAAWSGVIA